MFHRGNFKLPDPAACDCTTQHWHGERHWQRSRKGKVKSVLQSQPDHETPPLDRQCQKSIRALLRYGHFKSYFHSPVVWRECYVPSFKYSYPGTPSKTFIFIMFFFWTLFTKPARITKKLRFERGGGFK